MSEISPLVEVLFDENRNLTKIGAFIVIAMVVGMFSNIYLLLRGKRL